VSWRIVIDLRTFLHAVSVVAELGSAAMSMVVRAVDIE